MNFKCPYCEQKMSVADSSTEQLVRCPYCDQEISIPAKARAVVKNDHPQSVMSSPSKRRHRDIEPDDDDIERPIRSTRRSSKNNTTKRIVQIASIAGIAALLVVVLGALWFFDLLPGGGGPVPMGWVRVKDTLMTGALPPGGQAKKYADAASRKRFDQEFRNLGIDRHNHWFRVPTAGQSNELHYEMYAIESSQQTFGDSPDELKQAGQRADMLFGMVLDPLFLTVTQQKDISVSGMKGLEIWSRTSTTEEKQKAIDQKSGRKNSKAEPDLKADDDWDNHIDERMKKHAESLPPELRKGLEDTQKRAKEMKAEMNRPAQKQEFANVYHVHFVFAKGHRAYVVSVKSFGKPISEEDVRPFIDAFRPR